ncbi:hypothetical protein D0C36_23020 [Mucilaginibacter conchicola]|uniref:Plasmid mobilization relaxosome protein MobC n=1 Tax=Mucilaginibacter conchicola TaxID=2303333 RepID=A0A372NNC7_9SPHI|nr:hypothetical protein [Mucilaginibacter conchicola]RFZ90117.1 hypothetical protein D0C36_23020 [Mucilaginibacter conchicola]
MQVLQNLDAANVNRFKMMLRGVFCCFFAESKMYVCGHKRILPSLRGRPGLVIDPPESVNENQIMANNDEKRTLLFKIRLKPSEFQVLESRFKKTAHQNLSEFSRAMLLGKAVTVIHRDKAMDELLEELVLLRKELNAVGNNLNQAVRNINSAHGNADSRLLMGLLQVINSKVEPAIMDIKRSITEYAEVWLQKLKPGKV